MGLPKNYRRILGSHFDALRIGWGHALICLPYGEEFHKTRKLFQDLLSPGGVTIFEDIQLHQAHVFLRNLLQAPEDFSSHVTRYI